MQWRVCLYYEKGEVITLKCVTLAMMSIEGYPTEQVVGCGYLPAEC